MADETRFEEDEGDVTANKKYTFFIVDGSDGMFETNPNEKECDFKTALSLIFREMLLICCSRGLNNQIGIIVTNTENSDVETLENSVLLMPIGIPGQDEVNDLKELIDSEDIRTCFRKISQGSKICDIANVLNYCKRKFSSFPNTRHQSVVYFTNERNPFGRDDFWESSYFKRTKTAVNKIIGHGHRKTLGEFSVILLPTNTFKPEDREERRKQPWYHLDTEVFTMECDPQRRIRQITTATRSQANISLHIGGGVSFDVGVFAIVSEARILPYSQKFLAASEMPIEKRTGFMAVEKVVKKLAETDVSEMSETMGVMTGSCSKNDLSETREQEIQSAASLKRVIEMGGERISLTNEEYKAMDGCCEKGIKMIGFCSMSTINPELSIKDAKFLQPNEENTLGSTRIYRALLERCHARQQAMIATWKTRDNEKMRIVALVPFKKGRIEGEDEEMKQEYHENWAEFLHEGFYAFTLSYREESKDDVGRFEEALSSSSWSQPDESEKNVAKEFIKKLTMSFNPTFYENPRLLSQRAALVERATGEKIVERRDTLLPYHAHPERWERVSNQVEALCLKFSIGANSDTKEDIKPKKRYTKMDRSESKKGKNFKTMIEDGSISKLLKADIVEMVKIHCPDFEITRSTTKQNLIDALSSSV